MAQNWFFFCGTLCSLVAMQSTLQHHQNLKFSLRFCSYFCGRQLIPRISHNCELKLKCLLNSREHPCGLSAMNDCICSDKALLFSGQLILNLFIFVKFNRLEKAKNISLRKLKECWWKKQFPVKQDITVHRIKFLCRCVGWYSFFTD